jgi:hypothetical protein
MRRIMAIAVLLTADLPAWGQVQTFCSDIAGNIACTSYDNGASSQTYCTSIAGSLSCTTYGHTDQYNQVQVQQNYAVGVAIGTAVGNIVVAAIEGYREHKRLKQAKQDAWDQYVQDVLSGTELHCETEPTHATRPEDCRTFIFTLNQFIHRHQKDFVVDYQNMSLLSDAELRLDKIEPVASQTNDEEELERVFALVDKRQLDKQAYLGIGADRRLWDGREPLIPNTAAWAAPKQ